MSDIQFRLATRDDLQSLWEVAMRSKAHWGYDAEFMAQCRDALCPDAGMIDQGNIYLAEDGEILGFVSVDPLEEPGAIELEEIFIDPPAMGRGLGRRLVDWAKARARELGGSHLMILSDPQAEAFYAHLGAEKVGDAPSDAIPGRFLPRLRLAL